MDLRPASARTPMHARLVDRLPKPQQRQSIDLDRLRRRPRRGEGHAYENACEALHGGRGTSKARLAPTSRWKAGAGAARPTKIRMPSPVPRHLARICRSHPLRLARQAVPWRDPSP